MSRCEESILRRMIVAAGNDMGLVRLHRLSELQRYTICATDGEIGAVQEAQFDDRDWAVRYFLARAGNWYSGRSVLISTIALDEIDDVTRVLHVQLARIQIMESPPLTGEGPVNRQYEAEFFRYYGWPPYWQSSPPAAPNLPLESRSPAEPAPPPEPAEHLRSTHEIQGYRIAAADGEIGHLSDVIIDEKTWLLTYLVIDIRSWLAGRYVLLNPAWIKAIDWRNGSLVTDLRREAIQTAPVYDADNAVDRNYEIRLFEHYARKKYWE